MAPSMTSTPSTPQGADDVASGIRHSPCFTPHQGIAVPRGALLFMASARMYHHTIINDCHIAVQNNLNSSHQISVIIQKILRIMAVINVHGMTG